MKHPKNKRILQPKGRSIVSRIRHICAFIPNMNVGTFCLIGNKPTKDPNGSHPPKSGHIPSKIKIKQLIIPFIILLIWVFYLTTIRKGHEVGDDFAAYIHHAKNIVEGRQYGDTGYIYNPRLFIGPRNTPPGFPLLLAPVYLLFGFNLFIMKAYVDIFWIAFLIVFYISMRGRIPETNLGLLVLVVGLNPVVYSFKEYIGSDFPFVFFTYLTLYITHRTYSTGFPRSTDYKAVVSIAFLICMTYAIKGAGAVILPSLILYEIIKYHRLSHQTLLILCIFATYAAAQEILTASVGDYLTEMKQPNTTWILQWIQSNTEKLFGVVVPLLVLLGFIRAVISDFTIFETFTVAYTIALTRFPFMANRYLYPIFPLYLFYVSYSLAPQSKKTNRSSNKILLALLILTTVWAMATYYSLYKLLPTGPIYGADSEEFQNLYAFVKSNTTAKDVLIFFKPRLLALYTDRMVAATDCNSSMCMRQYMNSLNATYVIRVASINPKTIDDFKNGTEDFKEVYKNKLFIVYRLNKPPPPNASDTSEIHINQSLLKA